MMKQNKVMSVFDGVEMQKYFLLMTKEAEEVVYQEFIRETKMDIPIEKFLLEIKNIPEMKTMIQDMILTSISNLNWEAAFKQSFQIANERYRSLSRY